jgi:hypothetical protein
MGGILKRSLGMVEGAVRFAIPKSCGLEAATRDGQNVFTHTALQWTQVPPVLMVPACAKSEGSAG